MAASIGDHRHAFRQPEIFSFVVGHAPYAGGGMPQTCEDGAAVPGWPCGGTGSPEMTVAGSGRVVSGGVPGRVTAMRWGMGYLLTEALI